jgi:hypothetical protein
MTDTRERAIQVGLVILALPDLITGAWAVLDPSGWFRHYPGGGQHWVAVDGPYNHHLAIDAGVGFLAVGVALALAVVWREPRVRLLALVAFLVHDVPHLLYHLANPAHALSAGSRFAGDAGLVGAAVLGVILLLVVSRSLGSDSSSRTGSSPLAGSRS